MASDLATMLLSGNAAGVAMDPAMAQIAPQLQLAQTMAQQGLSTAPAYPAQALGRLAQSLAGVKMMHDATGELQSVYGNAAGAASRALPEDHPLQTALKSPDPYARMIALQQFPKAMLLLSEPKGLKSGETLNYPVPGNAPAASNTGDAAALAAAKQNPALIARAGGEARAKAPFEGGGEGVVQTPSGPVKIPITALTRAGIQPGAATPPPVVGPAAAGSTAPIVPHPVQTVPGKMVGAPGVTGTPLANPAIEPLVKADADELKADREAASKGQQDMATVRAIQDFLPKVQTGWSGETRLEAARILKSAGVKPETIQDFLKTDVGAGQLLQKKFLELSAGAARTMGAREPGSVISMFAKAYPNLGTDEQAIKLQTNALYMDRLRTQELANQKTHHLIGATNEVQKTGQYSGFAGFNEKFNAAHPTEAYFSAAEAMSGVPQAWTRIKDPKEQNAVINLIPHGTQYMAPDGKMRIKP